MLSRILFLNLLVLLGTTTTVLGENDDNEDKIKYYEDLINKNVADALAYQFATDAKMYEPEIREIMEMGYFDYIVIGAGSSGSVMASRLSEDETSHVLLLEAGDEANDFTRIPAYFAINSLTEYNWGYMTVPQNHACLGNTDNACRVPRGKGLGGTTLLTEMVYCRGDPMLYDKWANVVGDKSWAFDNVLEYFKKSEDFHKTNPNAPVEEQYHGEGGYLTVNHHVPPSNMSPIFLEANQILNHPTVDYNGKQQVGATILQLNTKNGQRLDQAAAFLKPASSRSNLVVFKNSFVIKIKINQNTKVAEGVYFTKNNRTYLVRSKREVILSAGAIASPQLLMLSGVGPKEHLEKNNIPVVQDLQVGSTLWDHVFVNLMFSSNMSTANETLHQQIKDYLKGYGRLTAANPIDGAGFYQTKSEPTKNYPNLEIVFSSAAASELGAKFLNWKDEVYQAVFNISIQNPFMLTNVLYHSQSVGSVRLASSSPYDYPLIDGNYLSDSDGKDMESLYESIQKAIELISTLPFKKIGANLEVRSPPGCEGYEFQSKPFWMCYIRHTSQSAYHPMGTCPMGKKPENGAVVDTEGRVYGVKNLRVVDASIFPYVLSAQPNAVCTMIAEKIADAIKQQYGSSFCGRAEEAM